MLRITVREKASEQRWILQGRLTKECIDELVSSWRAARRGRTARNRIVDLNEITVIDKSGEVVLSMMIGEGPRFVATGLYTKHLLEGCIREQEIPPIDSQDCYIWFEPSLIHQHFVPSFIPLSTKAVGSEQATRVRISLFLYWDLRDGLVDVIKIGRGQHRCGIA
jgi:hypothetical protein